MSTYITKDCPNCSQSNNIFGAISLEDIIGPHATSKSPLKVKIARGLLTVVFSICSNCATVTTYKLDEEQSRNIIYNIQL